MPATKKILALGEGAEHEVARVYMEMGEEVNIVVPEWDIFDPPADEKGKWDIVYLFFVLQRVAILAAAEKLENWVKLLKPGGEIHIIVPSLEWACRELLPPNEPDPFALHQIFGLQRNDKEIFLSGFTMDRLRRLCFKLNLEVDQAKTFDYAQTVEGIRYQAKQHHVVAYRRVAQIMRVPDKRRLLNELLILDPGELAPLPIHITGWNYVLDYPWLYQQIAIHGGKKILDVGSLYSGFGNYAPFSNHL